MKNNQWVLERIQKAGYKLTVPRKKIATWIAEQSGVFSVSELLHSLPKLDRVSIYRTVELFVHLDIIHSVLINHGEQHYEAHEQKHHHHVVCTDCETSECVRCDVSRERIPGFTQVHHSVIFTGRCLSCARTS